MEQLRPRWQAVLAALVLAVPVAACGTDAGDTDEAEPAPADTDEPADGEAADGEAADDGAAAGDAGDDDAEAGAVDLADVCPDPVSIQLDWEPESEHGPVYELLGEPYEVDADAKSVRGPLLASGEPTGVDIEIRAGGAPIGYQDAQSMLYQDRDLTFGFGRVGEMMTTHQDLRVTGIMATMEKSPYSVYWDPGTYPDVDSIPDLGEENVTVLVGPGTNVWADWLVQEGVWQEEQVDRSDSPKPASFIAAGGEEAEAGFATAEPFLYEHEVADQWGRPVEVELIHDVGFPEYFQVVVARTGDIEELADCFEQLVPVMQQAGVDYVADPDRVHDVVLDLVEQYDTGWVYTPETAEFAYETMLELEILANGPDGAFGSFDPDRVEQLRDIVASVTDLQPGDAPVEELVTNQFIDPDIGLP